MLAVLLCRLAPVCPRGGSQEKKVGSHGFQQKGGRVQRTNEQFFPIKKKENATVKIKRRRRLLIV